MIGLGNPGKAYKKTRHNIGFSVAHAFAQKHHFSFKRSAEFQGELAQGRIEGKRILLFEPWTYMNESGVAVRRVKDYYAIALERLIVICDDVALPLGTMRLRSKGSSGGHNGLKSIEVHLQTQDYPRLRIGVGYPQESSVRDYVLNDFTLEEHPLIEKVIVEATLALEVWMTMGIAAAMQKSNLSKERGNCLEKVNREKTGENKQDDQAQETSL